jgi:hypothetical protein
MCMVLNNQQSDVHVIPCHEVYNVGMIWDHGYLFGLHIMRAIDSFG